MRSALSFLTAVVLAVLALVVILTGLIMTGIAVSAAVVSISAAWPVAVALAVALVLLARRYGPRPPTDPPGAPIVAGRIGPDDVHLGDAA